MSDFIAHIANCLIKGDVFEKDGTSKIILDLEGKQIEIIQDHKIFNSLNLCDDFQGKIIESTVAIVRDVHEAEFEFVKEFIQSLCTLLSFIACSEVTFYSIEFPGHSSSWAIVGKTNIYDSLIDIRNGALVKDFIITVWKKYRSILKDRKLDVVFDYLFNANYPGSTIESKLVFSFVTLESLKYTFAKSKGILYRNGYFRKQNGKSYSFISLLEMMFSDIGIKFNNKDSIKTLRDEIIHSGFSVHDSSYNLNIFKNVQNLLHTYLVRLIGYDKNIRLYS